MRAIRDALRSLWDARWGLPTNSNFPCVDCGFETCNLCDGGISVDYDHCYAKERVPADYLNAGTLRTPLCSYCETMYGFCRFCRGIRGCTPFTTKDHWSSVPPHLSRPVTSESPAAAEAPIHFAIRTPDKPRPGYFADEPVDQEQRSLLKKAMDQRVDDAKRRRKNLEEKRLANTTAEETKLAIAEKQKQIAEARLDHLILQIEVRRGQQKAQRAALLHKEQQRWLQTQYPVILAERCIHTMDNSSMRVKRLWQQEIEDLLCGTTFERPIIVGNLWDTDEHLTRVWATIQGFLPGARKKVRVGIHLQELLEKDAPRTMFGLDPVHSLERLFKRCVPCANRIFTGNYSPLRMLHLNDYVLEKAFVYGILALSKWLGEKRFVYGVYGKWPPTFPEGLVHSTQGSTSSHLQ